jgi:adenylate kinase family enzyme
MPAKLIPLIPIQFRIAAFNWLQLRLHEEKRRSWELLTFCCILLRFLRVRIHLVGDQCSGKSFTLKLLEFFSIVKLHVTSMSKILADYLNRPETANELGADGHARIAHARLCMDKGDLVEQDIVSRAKAWAEAILQYGQTAVGDGDVRDDDQMVKAIERARAAGCHCYFVETQISTAEQDRRLAQRKKTEKRNDDGPAAVEKRRALYQKNVVPMMAHAEGLASMHDDVHVWRIQTDGMSARERTSRIFWHIAADLLLRAMRAKP